MAELSMNLPTEIVERAVRDKISAAIASQLGDPDELIKSLVSNALSQKVNSKGGISRSSYDNNHEFLEVISGNLVRDAAHDALREFFEEQKSTIKEAVKEEVMKSSSDIAKVLVAGMERSLKSSFCSTVRISFNGDDE